MRYLFAAAIAVFAIAVDLESSDITSVWKEPSIVAEAQSEPAVLSESRLAAPTETAATDGAADDATASVGEASATDPICEAVKTAAEENDIPIGFLARLLWQESRFQPAEVSTAGAQGIAQFMPQTAVEMGLKDPFDPLQAIPASARFLRKLYTQFGNLGLAAAAYNAGGGRIAKWLSRRGPLPKETRAYVKIITGHGAEAWTDEEGTVYMPTGLPQKAPCEGIGGLSRQGQIAAVNVDLTPAASAMLRQAEADAVEAKHAVARKLRVAAGPAARRAGKSRKQAVVRLASASSRTKSSRAAREL